MRAMCHRWRRTPLVITAHGWIEATHWLRLKSRLDRYCGTLANVRIATAARHASRLHTNTGVVMVIPNGVPNPGCLQALAKTRESIRKSLGVPREATIIGSVGRLSPEKRVDLLLNATHRLAPDHPDIHVFVVGGGDQRAELTALAHRPRVEVFEDELRAIMLDLFRELLSEQQVARTAMELIIGSTAIIDQLRSVMQNLSNPDTPFQIGTHHRSSWLRSDLDVSLLTGLAAAALWRHHRRDRDARRRADP